jgi:hypothetical protein
MESRLDGGIEVSEGQVSKKESLAEGLVCEVCNASGFQSKRELSGHKAGKHRQHKCSTCGEAFENDSKLGNHKIEVHGYTPKQLGWNRGGWNKGKGKVEEFNKAVTLQVNPEFMRKMYGPEYAKISARRFHEEVVALKEKELREQGYRTFNTSNYTHHDPIPDIIAISPDRKIFAVELETMKRYKSSIEALRRKYTPLLMGDKFFDDVILEGFKNEPRK